MQMGTNIPLQKAVAQIKTSITAPAVPSTKKGAPPVLPSMGVPAYPPPRAKRALSTKMVIAPPHPPNTGRAAAHSTVHPGTRKSVAALHPTETRTKVAVPTQNLKIAPHHHHYQTSTAAAAASIRKAAVPNIKMATAAVAAVNLRKAAAVAK